MATPACRYGAHQVRELYSRVPADMLGASLESSHVKLFEQINQIVTMVTAPSYKKNPVFKNQKGGGGGHAAPTKGAYADSSAATASKGHAARSVYGRPSVTTASKGHATRNAGKGGGGGGGGGGRGGTSPYGYYSTSRGQLDEAHRTPAYTGVDDTSSYPYLSSSSSSSSSEKGGALRQNAYGGQCARHTSHRQEGKRHGYNYACKRGAHGTGNAPSERYNRPSAHHEADGGEKPIVFHKPNVLTKSSTNASSTCVSAKPANEALENELKVHMNKITMSTYDKLFGKIRDILLDHREKNERDDSLFHYVFRRIFECASMNTSLLEIYVRLFHDAQEMNREACVETSQSQYDAYLRAIDDIAACNPQTDYDNYCKESKKNDSRRNMSRFMCELYMAGYVPPLFYHSFVKDMYMLLLRYIRCEASGHFVNEIIDNIHILLLTRVNDSMREVYARYFTEIYPISKISCQSGTKHDVYVSVTNKCIFKCRDIIETYGAPSSAPSSAKAKCI